MIAEVEPVDRGRYAGHLLAGGGMVPGAVPEEEVTEIRAKFLPMRRALGVAED